MTTTFASPLQLAELVKAVSDEIGDQMHLSGFPPTSQFEKGLRKAMRDSVNVSDQTEALRVEMELRKLIRDESAHMDEEIERLIRKSDLPRSEIAKRLKEAGVPDELVEKALQLHGAKAGNGTSLVPASGVSNPEYGHNYGTPNQPIFVEIPVTLSPVINVPPAEPTKKIVSRTYDANGDEAVTIETVPADK
jgi:hypothetical protein